MEKGYFGATATLVGCTVGAGILGIPYVVAKAGFLTGLVTLAIIALITLMINLYTGEIVLRTKGNHQLPSLAEKYLGYKGKYLMTVFTGLAIYGSLIAYGIGGGLALKALLGGNEYIYSLIFFAILSIMLFFGLKVFEKSELLLASAIIIVVALLTIIAFPHLNFSNLTQFSLTKLYMPYGVMIFAYMGLVAIPEMKQELKNKKLLKRAIILGAIISAIIYVIFTLITLGITGTNTTELATQGLGQALGFKMIVVVNLFALFAMTTSFLALGYGLKDIYNLDFKMHHTYAWLGVIIIPFLILLTKFVNFVSMLNITGIVADAAILSLILFIHHKAQKLGKRKPEYTVTNNWIIKSILLLIFIFGLIQTLLWTG